LRYEELRDKLNQVLTDAGPLRRTVLETLSRLRRRVEDYRQSAARLRTLLRASAQLQTTEDLSARLDLICRVIIDIRTYRRAVITLLDDELGVLGYGHAGLSEDEARELEKAKPLSPGERRKIFDERFRLGASYFIPYPESEKLFGRDVGISGTLPEGEYVNWHPRDLLFVPLRGPRGRLVGTLSVDDPFDGRRPTRDSLKVLELFANMAAGLIAADRLQAELASTSRFLQNLVANSADIIVATDSRGRIVLFNHAAEEILGYEASEIIGSHAGDLYAKTKDRDHIKRVLSEQDSIADFQTSARAKSGDEIPILLSANVLYDSDGRFIGTEGISKDLREYLLLEARLIVAEKQKTLAEAAVGVAHEVNNPLESIITACSLAERSLASKAPDLELVWDKLAIALREARRISGITARFTELAHGSGYRVTEVDGEVSMVDLTGDEERAYAAGDVCPLPRRYRVLIADDEPSIRALLAEYLAKEGFAVETAVDGDEVVRKATAGPPWDVVVTDIMMPKKTGYEVYSEIKERRPKTEVILMTGFGYDPTHSLLKARGDGLKAVLFKPFEPRVVRDKILEVLRDK
jgi:PAS domain S-box-containing protein